MQYRLTKAITILMLGSMMLCTRAFAETFTWVEAVSEARKNHPDLIIAKEQWNTSKADKMIAQSSFFPQISGDASAGRSKSPSTSLKSDSYSYGVSGSQLLFDGFKTVFEVQEAVKNVEAGHYRYDVASSDVLVNLRTSFIELIKSRELLGITQDIAKRRKQSYDLIKLRYEAGRENKGSLMTAEANLAQAVFEVDQAKRNRIFSQRRFLVALGISKLTDVDADGDLNLDLLFDRKKPDLEELAQKTPFLLRLMVLKEAAKWGVRSAASDFFPQVYATASTGKSASHWPPDRSEWSIGASVSMPFFAGGSNIASLSKAQSQAKQSQAEENSGRNQVVLTLEKTWNAYQDAVDQVGVQRKFLEAAAERSKIAEAQYATGLISFNDWIIIEDNFVREQKAYLNARAAALIAEAEWKQARGDTLDEE